MKEWRVQWWQKPYVQHQPKVLFVEAEDEEDAKDLAANHIERKFGIVLFSIDSCEPTKFMPKGKVIE